MGRRGRLSAASLAIVPAGGGNLHRPDPPDDLTEEQANEWLAIVEVMPQDWFRRENYPLLAQYCRATVSARYLSKVRDKLERAKRFDLEAYELVAKLISKETASLTSLARAMRLSQHASYDKKKSKGPTLPPPWED